MSKISRNDCITLSSSRELARVIAACDRHGLRARMTRHTPRYACLIVSLASISAALPEARMVPASSR